LPLTSVRRVVVLDGSADSAAEVSELLTAGGYAVAATADTRTALTWVRDEQAELLMVDMQLQVLEAVPRWERRKGDPQPNRTPTPDTEGYALLRPLGADPSAARYVAVVLGSREEALRDGAPRFALVGYVAKPVAGSDLLSRLESLLRSARLASRGNGSRLSGPTLTAAMANPNTSDDDVLSLEGDPLSGWGDSGEPFASLPNPLKKALLLDADTGYRAFLQDMLESHGFTVHEASERGVALRLALEKRPWLILTDTMMPGGDGFEFCRAVRGQSLLSHTPLVFVSAWDGYGERYQALKLGADDFLSKRAPVRELLIRLQLTLQRYAELHSRNHRGAGLEGSVDVVGTVGVLQMCHLGQLTGVLTATCGTRSTRVRFLRGEIVGADSGRLQDAEAIYDFVTWTAGRFAFSPEAVPERLPLGQSFDRLLLESCRLLDESRALLEPQAAVRRAARRSPTLSP